RDNFLCAIHMMDERVGVAAADLSTGEFRLVTAASNGQELDSVLARYAPREAILARGGGSAVHAALDGALITEREGWEFDATLAVEELTRHFGVLSLEGFGISDVDAPAVGAA